MNGILSFPWCLVSFLIKIALWTRARWRNQTVTFGSFPAPYFPSSPAHFGSIPSFSFFCFDPMLSSTPLHPLPLVSAPANKKAINSLWFCPSVFVPLPSFFSSSSSSYGFGRSFRGNTFFWLLFNVRSSLGGWENDTHRLNITALFNTARSYVAGWQP